MGDLSITQYFTRVFNLCRRNRSWLVNIGDQDSNVFSAQSGYAAPVVTDFSHADDPSSLLAIHQFNTSGGQWIQVHGKNFGPEFGASYCTRWNSDNTCGVVGQIPYIGDVSQLHTLAHYTNVCGVITEPSNA